MVTTVTNIHVQKSDPDEALPRGADETQGREHPVRTRTPPVWGSRSQHGGFTGLRALTMEPTCSRVYLGL